MGAAARAPAAPVSFVWTGTWAALNAGEDAPPPPRDPLAFGGARAGGQRGSPGTGLEPALTTRAVAAAQRPGSRTHPGRAPQAGRRRERGATSSHFTSLSH